MHRSAVLEKLSSGQVWDILIIGGGATGLGAAVDAASRGYKTLLAEQYDFGKGTSSRSTKLVHGGVRYLAQGNIKLVREALRERGWLLQNAPHLTQVQPFVIPIYKWWQKWYYAAGLRFYDLLSGKLSLGKTRVLTTAETAKLLPGIKTEGLSGGVLYYDGQFDDSRLCIDLAATAMLHGAVLVNYCTVKGFEKEKKKIARVNLLTREGLSITVQAKAVINATGVFTDAVLQLDEPGQEAMVEPSQGIHLVIDPKLFPGTHAMMIPQTDDGRVLFAVPWKQKIVLGTTDTAVDDIDIEPRALDEEIDFVLMHINRYFNTRIERSQVQSVFAGLRPLVRSTANTSTALLSRDHTIVVSNSGMVTVTGGKWTTYRRMAQDAVDNAVFTSRLDKRLCVTAHLPIGDPLAVQALKKQIAAENEGYLRLLHPDYPYTLVDIVYAVRHELALTLEDVLARRTRILFQDASAALAAADVAAPLMRILLEETDAWEKEQMETFAKLAAQYRID